MKDSEITYKIRGCAYQVYKYLGPGVLESVYEEALVYELHESGLKVERQVPIPIDYKGHHLANDLRLDLLVESSVIVELKAVQELLPVHFKQLYSYLRLAKKNTGVLINFCVSNIFDGMKTVNASDNRWI